MKTIQNTSIRIFLCVLMFGTLFSCKKDEKSNNTEVEILVVDENNIPLSNAKVSDGNQEVKTDNSGIAVMKNPEESYGKFRFGVESEGYFSGSINVTPDSVKNQQKIKLLKATKSGEVPSTGGTLTGTDWSFTSNGGFIDENGIPVSGNIEISVRYIRPDDLEAFKEAFPGRDSEVAFGGNSGNNVYYCYGYVAIIYSSGGKKVFPEKGSVSITVQVPGIYANAAKNGGKVYYYDTNANIWEESATPTVTGLDVIMPLPSDATFCSFGKTYQIASLEYELGYNDETGRASGKCDDGINWIIQEKIVLTEDLVGFREYTFVWSNAYGFPPKGKFPILANVEYNIKFEKVFSKNGVELGRSLIYNIPSKKYPPGTTDLGIIDVDENNCNIENPTNPTKSGSFTYDGKTYSGECVVKNSYYGCTTSNDVFWSPDEFSNGISIINMPMASSGSYNFVRLPISQPPNPFCETFSVFNTPELAGIEIISGTLTKTGARKFTFTGISEEGKAITGFGEY